MTDEASPDDNTEFVAERTRRDELVRRLAALERENREKREAFLKLSKRPIPSASTQQSNHRRAMLDGIQYMADVNAHLRASLAALLKQQEQVVAGLSQLALRDKETIERRLRKKLADHMEGWDDDEDDEVMSPQGNAPSLSRRPTSDDARVGSFGGEMADGLVVNAQSLDTEWPRLLPVLNDTSDQVTQPVLHLATSEQKQEVIRFIVNTLAQSRDLYAQAMTKGTTGADPDSFMNFGFSMAQMPGYEYEFDEPDSENNIVMHEHNTDGEQIKAASLDKLIERMTLESKQDLNVRYTFLLTLHTFTTPREMLERLQARYYVPLPPNMTREEIELFVNNKLAPVQIKVFAVIKKWLEDYYDQDFASDVELRGQLKTIIERMIQHSGIMGKWSQKSARALLALLKKKEDGLERTVDAPSNFPKSKVAATLTSENFVLLETKPLEIARQVSLMDFELFQAIHPREFLGQGWNKPDKEKRAPNVVAMITRFNQINAWVQKEILGYRQQKQRTEVLIKFLKVAKHLRKMSNFHSFYAIVTALNSNPIHRLTKTWEALPDKQQERFASFRELINPNRNSVNFRRALERAEQPCIPHLGLFLMDLTFIEDGNPNFLKSLHNFFKRRLLANRIIWIKQFQQSSYNFAPVPVIQEYIRKNAQVADEEFWWELSLRMEPREPKPVQ